MARALDIQTRGLHIGLCADASLHLAGPARGRQQSAADAGARAREAPQSAAALLMRAGGVAAEASTGSEQAAATWAGAIPVHL